MEAVNAREAAAELEQSLRKKGTAERAAQEKRYLKSALTHLGVTVPNARLVARSFVRAHRDLRRAELLAIVAALWKKPIYELRSMAVMFLDEYSDRLEPADLKLVERFLRESKTWALVDELSARVAGSIVERYPRSVTVLDRWSKDEDFWLRRSAMLALLGPLRRGEGDFDRFARYADGMLGETEFFIRKAIGWILRDTSKHCPALVADWLLPRAHRASGVTVREAVMYLDAPPREAIMATYSGASKPGAQARN
jgi:3-methyladenine DNA glycosylase AlkD